MIGLAFLEESWGFRRKKELFGVVYLGEGSRWKNKKAFEYWEMTKILLVEESFHLWRNDWL